MSKLFIIVLAVLLSASTILGQYLEVGLGIGVANYFGELQNRVIQPSEYNLAISAFGRYNLSSRLAMEAHLLQGKISGTDANATLALDQRRNLSFRSDVLELGVSGEFNLIPYNRPANKISAPYIFHVFTHFFCH